MRLVLVVIATLLFGGCEPKSDPLPTYGALPDGVFVASARNMESRGLMWVSSGSTEGRFASDLPQQVIAAPTVMILIHGYNTPAAKVSAYFEGLISYLRIDRDYRAPMVIYDWKSTARHWEDVPFEEQQAYTEFLASTVGERLGGRVPGLPPGLRWESMQYAGDRTQAATSGVEGLARLVQQIAHGRQDVRIIVLAHSMGSQVVVDALRLRPGEMSAVKKIVLLAPDVDAGALQSGKLGALPGLEALHVFYSRHDEIVAAYSRMANLGFSRLGATGPADIETLPRIIHIHDVGAKLGTSDVHGHYVTRSGAATLRLEDFLQ